MSRKRKYATTDPYERRIKEIENEMLCSYNMAREMFFDEICEKYRTDNVDMAVDRYRIDYMVFRRKKYE